MWYWAAVMDLIMVRLHGLTLETSLCIQLTYAWLTFCWNEAGRLTVSVHQHRRSTNVQDLDWAVKQTDSGKTSKTNPGFQPLKSKWRGSGHPFLSFIWPAVSSWDDQHFKLTRNGKRAPEPTRCNSRPSLYYCFKDTNRRGITLSNRVPHWQPSAW